MIYIIPLRISLVLADILGLLTFIILRKYREITLENLRIAFGSEKTEAEIYAIGRRVFQNLARNAVEMVNFPKLNKENIASFVEMRHPERFDEAYKKGKGIIIITAHFGNWELMAATLRLRGYPGTVIGRRIYFKKYDDYLNKLRKLHDVQIIYRDDSPRKTLKALKENRIVGIVADQDVDSVEGVFVDFFGRQSYTPIGPVVLARVTGAVLLPVLIMRENGRHVLVADEPVELTETGDKEADIIKNTQKWSSVIESYIRRRPDQWVWMHRRWKTKKV